MQRIDTLPSLQGGVEQCVVVSRYLGAQLVSCSLGGVQVPPQTIHIRVTLHQLHTKR